ncbi:MAG: ATP-NAD kinase family protein [Gammaproteobacteria bacterium]|nr:ATP-NAD kinase family protein [Gammaproteobacteria bacterium]
MQPLRLKIGLVVNPLAGLGGSLGRKGSDGPAMREHVAALSGAQRRRSQDRAERALGVLSRNHVAVDFVSWAGDMGADVLGRLGLSQRILGERSAVLSSSQDTRAAAIALRDTGVDLLVFVGGDGTARDILDAVGSDFPVLGVPAGVKMHSGVFAVSPEAAGELLLQLANAGLVALHRAQVRDIDEDAFRKDIVRSRFYGELTVPSQGTYLQHTKIGGRESGELVAAEAAQWIVETMQPGATYFIGPGSTMAAISQAMDVPGTLLGVDIVRDGQLIAADADEAALLAHLERSATDTYILVTAIGGQGHIFGRGNQQFSPTVIRRTGLANISVVAAKSKISALQGRPLLVDTNDPELDAALSGYRQIITGYDDYVLYPVGQAGV